MPASLPSSPPTASLLEALAAGLPAGGCGPFPVVVGCSGGADSLALLLGLVRLGPAAAPRLVVAHAEHDLREAAAADREFVRGMAADLGLAFVHRRLTVREATDVRGEGLEGRARRLRYRFLGEAAHEAGARHVLVAHTADDQAETILHRALRGTGLSGLAGMRRARALCDGVSLVRPLLGVARRDLRKFLVEQAAMWCEDESNADRRYARNFLRHEVLARCEAGPYPAASRALVRLGEQAGQVAAALASAADHLLDGHASRGSDGTVVLRTAGLGGLHRQLLAQLFVRLWEREGWPRRDMTAEHFAGLAGLARPATPSGTVRQFPGGITASVRGPHLVLAGS